MAKEVYKLSNLHLTTEEIKTILSGDFSGEYIEKEEFIEEEETDLLLQERVLRLESKNIILQQKIEDLQNSNELILQYLYSIQHNIDSFFKEISHREDKTIEKNSLPLGSNRDRTASLSTINLKDFKKNNENKEFLDEHSYPMTNELQGKWTKN